MLITTSISPLNKDNIVINKNNTNISNNDKNSNSDSGGNNYNINKGDDIKINKIN